jgi:hypothetical protein
MHKVKIDIKREQCMHIWINKERKIILKREIFQKRSLNFQTRKWNKGLGKKDFNNSKN